MVTVPGPSATMPQISQMRIAMFSDAIPDRNGVGTYYRDLSVHLSDRVERVELFCPEQDARGRWRDPVRLPLPGDKTQKICIPNPRQMHRRYVRLEPHAVVLSTPGPYGFLGLWLARKSAANIVVGFHTHLEKLTELYWQKSPGFGRLSKWYLESSHRLLFRHGQIVLVNSEAMVAIAKKIGANDVKVMGTTIAPVFINTPVTPLREQLRIVTFAGRLAAEKHLESIIAAAQAIPAIEFRIAGDGPQRELVAAAAERIPNLSYLGWLPRSRMPVLIDATDMLVLPSHVESFGTIALEAMTRNRTVLVSRECGITQWKTLSPGLNQIGADETLTDAVLRVASLDPALRSQKAKLARTAACELNEWAVNHWLDVLSRSTAAGVRNA
ncbi:MAG: glycosyltransferase [Gammaproteobacteria bacterium]|nr:glycosyltransferase [Gammaproteobacteria bacterium]MDH3767228.1 glycosyltransferase [Gammaproteobacteria bacterium]